MDTPDYTHRIKNIDSNTFILYSIILSVFYFVLIIVVQVDIFIATIIYLFFICVLLKMHHDYMASVDTKI
jgi:hypothetical protein